MFRGGVGLGRSGVGVLGLGAGGALGVRGVLRDLFGGMASGLVRGDDVAGRGGSIRGVGVSDWN